MNANHTTTYAPGKLLIAIVSRGRGESVMSVAKAAGARGGTILMGRGHAENRLLQLLGLDDTEQDIVLTLLSFGELQSVLGALQSNPHMLKMPGGLAVCLDVAGILRHVPAAVSLQTQAEPDAMSANATHELISVIVNTGFADEIMTAARKAGATGGTIINARGTGREEDVKFFGIHIVPEKEFLMMLVPKADAPAILDAVRSVPCLREPGAGIAFCMDVERFVALGRAPAAKA